MKVVAYFIFINSLIVSGAVAAAQNETAPSVHGINLGDPVSTAEAAVGFRLVRDVKTYPNGRGPGTIDPHIWEGHLRNEILMVETNDEGRIRSLEYTQLVDDFPLDNAAINSIISKATEKYGTPAFRSTVHAAWEYDVNHVPVWSLTVTPERVQIAPDKHMVSIVTRLQGYVPPTAAYKAEQDRRRAAGMGEVHF